MAVPAGGHPLPDWLGVADGDESLEWALIAWRRAEAQPGAWYDAAKADAVVAMWPGLFRLVVDRFAGVPFRLRPWQEIIVRLLVGWKIPTEVNDPLTDLPTTVYVRLFRTLRLWVPRKNGKTEFMAALGLLFWAVDAVMAGEGYCFGRDETQGRIVFDRMKAMIAYEPRFAEAVQSHKNSIYLKAFASPFVLLTGAEEGKHGKGPTVTIGDEMHEWKSRKVENDLRQGSGGRLQPIELYGSTAGLKTNLTGVELWDESVAILEGRIDDPTTLVVVFAAKPDDDWKDEAVWARANPSLGLSPTLNFMRREAAKAANNPRAEAQFRCYHLGQWVDSTVRWINIKKWDACTADKAGWKARAAALAGRRCFAAFDVSSTRDVTALVLLFPPIEGEDGWQVLCRFWVPEETLAERVKVDRVAYDRWVKVGAMEVTPGNFVDQNFVLKALIDAVADFDVQRIGFDPWNAMKLVADAQAEGVDPDLFRQVRQGVQSLGEPSKHFERLVYAGQLDHGGHPVLRWMAGNAVVRFDENLNFMPAKKRSPEKIDGIVAAVMALAAAFAEEDEGGMDDYLAAMRERAAAA